MGTTAKILICPLEWGLGHATRDIPIIRKLAGAGLEVIIAADGYVLELLRDEFPELESTLYASSVNMRYSRRFPAWFKITLLLPILLFEIFLEHRKLSGLVKRFDPDLIISDNRYGAWHRRVRSILITHQLSIRLPGFARILEWPLYRFIRLLASRFSECWIPDYGGEMNLAGDLCHRWKLPANAKYIGPLSRFDKPVSPGVPLVNMQKPGESHEIDLLVILSGPEPQRSQLQKIILKQIFLLKTRCVILQGLPGRVRRTDLTSTVTMFSHLPGGELRRLMQQSRSVLCRSGYTSIMELHGMHKKAMLIPTPGQTEQEYLAEYLSGKGFFRYCSQYELDLEFALEDLASFEPDFRIPVDPLLDEAIQPLIRQLKG